MPKFADVLCHILYMAESYVYSGLLLWYTWGVLLDFVALAVLFMQIGVGTDSLLFFFF